MPMHSDDFVQDFAVSFFPTWLGVVILIAVLFGLWKLATIVWAAISH